MTGIIKFPIVYNFSRSIAVSLKQTAFFGEVTLRPLSGLAITGGVRRYSYDKTSTSQVLMTSYINGSTAGPPLTTNDDASGWVTKLNISYDVTDALMVYATRSEGFRPGGLNNTPNLPAYLVSYSSDSLINYEIGVKSTWFDRLLTLNLSFYRIDWSDMQISASIPNFSFITNVGAARIQGMEAEFTLRPMAGLVLNGNAAYQHGVLRADQINDIVTAAGKKGDRIPFEPIFTAALSAQYDWTLSDAADAYARMDFSYTGRSYSEFRPTSPQYERMGDFSTVNMRVGVDYADWDVSLFVNNLFDVNGRVRVSSSTASALEQATISTTPRTIGVNVRRTF